MPTEEEQPSARAGDEPRDPGQPNASAPETPPQVPPPIAVPAGPLLPPEPTAPAPTVSQAPPSAASGSSAPEIELPGAGEAATRAGHARRTARLGIGVTLTFLIAMLGDWTLAYLAPIFAALMLQQPSGPTLGGALKVLLATFLVSAACLGAAALSQVMPAAFLVFLFPALYWSFRLGLRGGSVLIMLVALCGLMLTPMVANATADIARDVARSFPQNIGLSLLVALAMYALIPPLPSEPAPKPKPELEEAEVRRRAALLTLVTGSYAVLYFSFMWSNVHTPLYIAVYAYSMNLGRTMFAAKGILAANIAAGVLTMFLYQITEMAPYLPFVAVMILTVNLLFARMITSDASLAPLAGFGLSVLMILYGDTIQPFADDGGSSFADRFGELFMAALWAIAALAVLETFFPMRGAGQEARGTAREAPSNG